MVMSSTEEVRKKLSETKEPLVLPAIHAVYIEQMINGMLKSGLVDTASLNAIAEVNAVVLKFIRDVSNN